MSPPSLAVFFRFERCDNSRGNSENRPIDLIVRETEKTLNWRISPSRGVVAVHILRREAGVLRLCLAGSIWFQLTLEQVAFKRNLSDLMLRQAQHED